MAPRRYRADRRQAAMAETRRRIVEATVALHAEQGGLATSYAQIAAGADVAVPTVYKHFPTEAALFTACTGHVHALSPPLGPEIFARATGVEARVGALVAAVFACHRFQRPWLRLGVHEAALIPAVGAIMDSARRELHRLIALSLAPCYGKAPPPALVLLFEILLHFTAWQRLAEAPQKLSPEAVATAALLALLGADQEKKPAKERSRKGKSKP